MEAAAQAIIVAVLGLSVGSFLNVVAVRLPEHRSVWRPGSGCPSCGTPIAWRDNIPLLSFAVLRGRCRACGSGISWRYPAVEFATAVSWIAAYLVFGMSPRLPIALVFLSALVVITAVDFSHRIIPNVITLPGILAGFAANLAAGSVSWLDSLLGIVIGGGLFLIIIAASGGRGMGLGDMKLAAMFGAFLGWKITLVALFIAVMLGGILATTLLVSGRMRRKDAIPFGPFLALGAATGLLWGDEIVRWYVTAFAR